MRISTEGKRDLDFGEGSCVRGIFKERVCSMRAEDKMIALSVH